MSQSEKLEFVLSRVGPSITAASLGLGCAGELLDETKMSVQSVQSRLDILHSVITLITSDYSGAVAAQFMRGSDSFLDGMAPVVVLRDEEPSISGPALLHSAQYFVS